MMQPVGLLTDGVRRHDPLEHIGRHRGVDRHVRQIVDAGIERQVEVDNRCDVSRDDRPSAVGDAHQQAGRCERHHRYPPAEDGAGLQRELEQVDPTVEQPLGLCPCVGEAGQGHGRATSERHERVAAGDGEQRAGGDEAGLGGAECVLLAEREDRRGGGAEVPHGGHTGTRPGAQVRHARPAVNVGVDQAGQDRPAANVDHPGAGRDLDRVNGPGVGDAPAVDDHSGVDHRRTASAVDQTAAGEHEVAVVPFGLCAGGYRAELARDKAESDRGNGTRLHETSTVTWHSLGEIRARPLKDAASSAAGTGATRHARRISGGHRSQAQAC